MTKTKQDKLTDQVLSEFNNRFTEQMPGKGSKSDPYLLPQTKASHIKPFIAHFIHKAYLAGADEQKEKIKKIKGVYVFPDDAVAFLKELNHD